MKPMTCFARIRWSLLCLTICLPARSQNTLTDLVGHKPSWEIGQAWFVEVETQTEPPRKPDEEAFVPKQITYGYAFKVEGYSTVEDELCYQVRIYLVTRDGNSVEAGLGERKDFYRIFNRTEDYSLKMIQRLDVQEGVVQACARYPQGPVHATKWTGFLPLDFPVFSQEASKYEPPISGRSAREAMREQATSLQKCGPSQDAWIVNGTERSALNIVLVREHPGSQAGPEITQQVWAKGMPWPLRVEYRHGERPPLRAKLVRLNGSRVTAVPRVREPKE